MDDEFKDKGFVKKILNRNSDEAETNKGRRLIRHASQLRRLKERDF